jgi:hypothetical protein
VLGNGAGSAAQVKAEQKTARLPRAVSTEIAISSALRPLLSAVVLVMFLLMLCLDRNSHEHPRCCRARHELACTTTMSASGFNKKVANITEQHVPISVMILYKFASYSSNKADDDFPPLFYDSEGRMWAFSKLRWWYKA